MRSQERSFLSRDRIRCRPRAETVLSRRPIIEENPMPTAISPVGSPLAGSIKPEALEPPGRDTRKDGDQDEAASASAATSAPKPTVNTQGQTIGAVLNTKA
jgi:hypothetical protein